MDAIDFKILKILQKKARIPNVEVARKIGMAPSAVLERIKKLEARGIIDGYEVRLNPKRFNCSTIAFIFIKTRPASLAGETGKTLAGLEQIQEIHHLAGEDCLMVKIKVADTCELEHFLRKNITSLASVVSIKTFIALATHKESARIPLPETMEKNV